MLWRSFSPGSTNYRSGFVGTGGASSQRFPAGRDDKPHPPSRPRTRIVHADPGRAPHGRVRNGIARLEPHLISQERLSVQRAIHLKRAREPPRSRRGFCPLRSFRPSQKDRRRVPLRPAHHVQAVMHPVHQIDVGDPPPLEHRRVARRPPPEGMARAIARTVVGFHLDETSAEHAAVGEPPAESAAQQIARYGQGQSRVERRG